MSIYLLVMNKLYPTFYSNVKILLIVFSIVMGTAVILKYLSSKRHNEFFEQKFLLYLTIGNIFFNDPHYFFRTTLYDNNLSALFISTQFILIIVFILSVFNKILIKSKFPDYSEFNHNILLFGYLFLAVTLLLWQFTLWHFGKGNTYVDIIFNNENLFKQLYYIMIGMEVYIILRMVLNLFYMRNIWSKMEMKYKFFVIFSTWSVFFYLVCNRFMSTSYASVIVLFNIYVFILQLTMMFPLNSGILEHLMTKKSVEMSLEDQEP